MARLVPLVLILTSCQISFAPRPLDSISQLHDPADISATTEQARLRLRSLVDPMCGEIEATADRIIGQSDSSAMRRTALEWKSQAVPAMREALFQPRPVVALFDSWGLSFQMIDYFSSGAGSRSFGIHRKLALECSMRLESEFHAVAASFTESGMVDDARHQVRNWAAAHPIHGPIAHRESATSLATKIDLGPGFSGAEVIGSLALTADDLNRKLEVYSDQLVRQGRWEAELLAIDLGGDLKLSDMVSLGERTTGSVERIEDVFSKIDGSFGRATDSVDTIVPLLERLTATAEKAPDLLARERAVTVEAIQGELGRTIDFAREERATALDFISAEREVALQTLHEAIIEERKVITRDVEDITSRAIDRAFRRLAELIAMVGVIAFLAGIGTLVILRRMIPRMILECRQASSGS